MWVWVAGVYVFVGQKHTDTTEDTELPPRGSWGADQRSGVPASLGMLRPGSSVVTP